MGPFGQGPRPAGLFNKERSTMGPPSYEVSPYPPNQMPMTAEGPHSTIPFFGTAQSQKFVLREFKCAP